MPERKKITWAQLRVGTMVTVSLVVLAVGIFFISGQIGFLTRRYTLKAYFSGAGGLREGAQVRLAGIPVGNVAKIRISRYTEPNRAVEVVMRVTKRYQDQIRTDSEAMAATAGLLGESYVDISRGGPGQAVVPEGGEVKSREEADIKRIVQNTNDVISNLRVLSGKLNDITNQITSGRGSIGKLLYDTTFYDRLNETTGATQRLMASVEKGQGTLGKLVSDEALYQRMNATFDHVNQVMDEIQHGKGSMAKFISDPAVYDNANKVIAQANMLVDNINKGRGTLGQLVNDPQLYNRMNETVDHVNSITTRMEKGQGTLGKLSTDPALFNNLNESARSIREFLTEFRQNPRKYMTVHVKIF